MNTDYEIHVVLEHGDWMLYLLADYPPGPPIIGLDVGDRARGIDAASHIAKGLETAGMTVGKAFDE
jgi:hypothetical protein